MISEKDTLTPHRPRLEGALAKTLPCTVCQSTSRLEGGFSDVRLFRCPNCEHCFTDTCSLEIEEAYTPKYFTEEHKNWFDHPDVDLFERIYQLAIAKGNGQSVLDVGCGTGNLLQYLRRRNPRLQLTGIDVAPAEVHDRIDLIRGDFLTWNFQKPFDVVVSLQVIEHIADPKVFVRRLSELCAGSGVVVTNTINEHSVLYTAARLAKSFGLSQAYQRLYSRHHLNHFNTSSLARLMKDSGLDTVAHLRHNAPMVAMDIPASNAAIRSIYRAGVWGTFMLGAATGRATYQTIVCHKSLC
jgi:2-polyprenyl-3-methyl-5-hydroxy-6-metoxy-1,4-benzoquinol methylase